MIVANPIYDIVFKYLMEDERVARTILSALLKKDVVEVHTRRNEYANQQRDSLSIFRIDFGATIREADGTEQLILIELQKTWLETETLRFRQYLGAQYANKENITGSGRGEHALPMVAVYLLGHKVGDIEEPVVYVNHQVCDYNERPVTKGVPDPFVESLTHNSIIVQIPRLHGRINNRLDKVLSIFDQTRADSHDSQTLNIDADMYGDDTEMQPILHRLVAAAADAEMRHKMNVEDEFFSVLEKRETEIMMQEERLQQQAKKLQQQGEKLQQQDEKLQRQDEKLQQQDEKLQQKDSELQSMLRKSVMALQSSGMSLEAIATTLGQDIETIRKSIS